MTNPLTTATSVGVAIRYAITVVSSILAIVSILGWLSPEQVQDIIEKVRLITAQVPELLTAGAGLVAILLPLYATLTKSSSDKAAAVAKAVDAAIPAAQAVIIPTPDGMADIVVQPSRGR